MAFLEVKNIKKAFGATKVLHGIDFSMEKGQVTVIIGSSGGGKTTFLRCLNFLETPNEGTISIGGEEIYNAESCYTDAEIREKRLHFGLVFQSFNLFPQYTARTNIAMPLALRMNERLKVAAKAAVLSARAEAKEAILALEGDKKAASAARREIRTSLKAKERAIAADLATHLHEVRGRSVAEAERLLAEVGLSDKMDLYPHQLSGGQCQRVAIARALALSPDVLCFDEPTSALDPELTGEVLRVIRSLRDKNRTMVIVTHEMEFAKSVADKVVFIAGGVIVEEGTPEEIFENPKSPELRAFIYGRDAT